MMAAVETIPSVLRDPALACLILADKGNVSNTAPGHQEQPGRHLPVSDSGGVCLPPGGIYAGIDDDTPDLTAILCFRAGRNARVGLLSSWPAERGQGQTGLSLYLTGRNQAAAEFAHEMDAGGDRVYRDEATQIHTMHDRPEIVAISFGRGEVTMWNFRTPAERRPLRGPRLANGAPFILGACPFMCPDDGKAWLHGAMIWRRELSGAEHREAARWLHGRLGLGLQTECPRHAN